MNHYRYRAADPQGHIQIGRLHATDLEALELQLRSQGLDLLRARRIWGWTLPLMRKRELITLCFHLEQNCRAGIPVLSGLRDLQDTVDSPRLRQIYAQLAECIAGGRTLSSAMQDFPEIFDSIFVGLVRAGESTGDIAKIFHEAGQALQWQDEQQAQLKRALIYPSLVLLTITAVFIFLMLYLVPEMTQFMAGMDQPLPMYTRLLIMCSTSFAQSGYWLLGILVLGGLLLTILLHYNQSAGLWADTWLLRLPIFGTLLHKRILARIGLFFAMMYAAGITILDCLRTSEQLSGNRVIGQAMSKVYGHVSEGVCLSDSFRHAGQFPSLFVRLIEIGERTGTLETSLRNIHYFYSRDVRELSEHIQTLIEPCASVVLGGLVAWIMFSILGPIYTLVATLQI